MSARPRPELVDPRKQLPHPLEVLPQQMMGDSLWAGIALGYIPADADPNSVEAKNGRRRVRELVQAGRLHGRWCGKEWRFSTAHLLDFLCGHDDPSASQVAS